MLLHDLGQILQNRRVQTAVLTPHIPDPCGAVYCSSILVKHRLTNSMPLRAMVAPPFGQKWSTGKKYFLCVQWSFFLLCARWCRRIHCVSSAVALVSVKALAAIYDHRTRHRHRHRRRLPNTTGRTEPNKTPRLKLLTEHSCIPLRMKRAHDGGRAKVYWIQLT